MCRISKFKSLAYNFSTNSKQKYKHGCIITKNSKLITYGVNQGMRTKCLNNIRSCVHAEIDAAYKLIKMLKRKHGKNYKTYISKYMILVVRSPNYHHEELIVIESKPCYYCTKDLLNLGFNKIGYSTNNNEIVYDKLSNLINNNLHKSNLQLSIEKYY
tara:strand:+ start:87 stop:560 length:474 start_codon:yes stop_codon:yes gene_type:complete